MVRRICGGCSGSRRLGSWDEQRILPQRSVGPLMGDHCWQWESPLSCAMERCRKIRNTGGAVNGYYEWRSTQRRGDPRAEREALSTRQRRGRDRNIGRGDRSTLRRRDDLISRVRSQAHATRAWRANHATRAWRANHATRSWRANHATRAWRANHATRAWRANHATRAEASTELELHPDCYGTKAERMTG